jgi:membrane-associated protein
VGLTAQIEHLIGNFGPLGAVIVAFIIFAESGLLIGFFLPGDSLLFTAGLLAHDPPGLYPLPLLIGLTFPAAVIGDSVGYSFGNRVGRRLYQRPDSRFFKKEHLRRAESFYAKHGGKAIILARFVPVVRTFVPIVAGAAAMPYRSFVTYNVIGGALWAVGIPVAGYALGSMIPAKDVDKYLLPIIAVIIIASILPAVFHWWKDRSERRTTVEAHTEARPR